MLSKIRPANWFLMLVFSFGLLVPAGWIVALPTASAQEPTIRSPVEANGFSCDFTLQQRVAVESNGEPLTQTVTIGDHVWYDTNENGLQDAYPYNRSAELGRVPHTGVAGVLCLLCEQGKAVPVASAISDFEGNYTFTLDVSQSAMYYIAVIPPTGYDFTLYDVNNNENDLVDSDVDPATGRTDLFQINPGEGNHTLDVGLIDAVATPTAEPVRMLLSPTEITTGIGERFEVNVEVEVNSSDQAMEEALAYLNFDPEVLQVEELIPGSDLPSVLRNGFDNDAGHIDFAANKPAAPYPSDTFTLATISFITLRPTNNTFISFNQELPRKSDVTFDNRSVLSSTAGNLVSIVIPTAIDSVTLKSDAVSSSAGWGSGLLLLMLSLTMLVRWRRRGA